MILITWDLWGVWSARGGFWKSQRGSADALVSPILTRALPSSMCSSTLFSPVLRKGLQVYCALFSSPFPFFFLILLFLWDLTRVAMNPGWNVAAFLWHCMDTNQAGPEMWGKCRHLGFWKPPQRNLSAINCCSWRPLKASQALLGFGSAWRRP